MILFFRNQLKEKFKFYKFGFYIFLFFSFIMSFKIKNTEILIKVQSF